MTNTAKKNLKTALLRILSVTLQIVPVVVVLYSQFPVMVDTPMRRFSLATIITLLMCAVIFKDAIAEIVKTPSVFKISLFMVAIGYFAITFGQTFLMFGIAGLVGSVVSMPIDAYCRASSEDTQGDKIVEMLVKAINGGQDETKSK